MDEKKLQDEINKLYKTNPELFPEKVEDINDTILNKILERILKKGNKWNDRDKIEWKNTLANKNDNWESVKIESEQIISNWIESKIKKINYKKQLKISIQKLLEENENDRIRTTEITTQLKKLENNEFNNYNLFSTRQAVYECIADLRKEYRDEEFENGYIISGKILDELKDKVDGWQFTKNLNLIVSYFKKEIEQHEKAVENFIKYKEEVEAKIQKKI